MFISEAYAQAASSPFSSGAGFVQILPFVAIAAVFYFMLFRPQQRKMKEHKTMLAAVKRGDRVITSGGIIGVVTKVVDDNELQLEIAEGVRVRILKGSINDVLNRPDSARTPDKTADKDGKASEKTASGSDKKSGSR